MTVFRCARCGREVEDQEAEKEMEAAIGDLIPVEPLCEECWGEIAPQKETVLN